MRIENCTPEQEESASTLVAEHIHCNGETENGDTDDAPVARAVASAVRTFGSKSLLKTMGFHFRLMQSMCFSYLITPLNMNFTNV